jgi:hypothetical protein
MCGASAMKDSYSLLLLLSSVWNVPASLFEVMTLALIKIDATQYVATRYITDSASVCQISTGTNNLLPAAEYSDFLLLFNFFGSCIQKVPIHGGPAMRIVDLPIRSERPSSLTHKIC